MGLVGLGSCSLRRIVNEPPKSSVTEAEWVRTGALEGYMELWIFTQCSLNVTCKTYIIRTPESSKFGSQNYLSASKESLFESVIQLSYTVPVICETNYTDKQTLVIKRRISQYYRGNSY